MICPRCKTDNLEKNNEDSFYARVDCGFCKFWCWLSQLQHYVKRYKTNS